MSIITILSLQLAKIIYLEFDEKNPSTVFNLYFFMFNFVVISYKYTYVFLLTSKYFSFGDNEIDR